MHALRFLPLLVYMYMGVQSLRCRYTFDDGGRCSLVWSAPNEDGCPELCLTGRPRDSCKILGVDCEHGAYFPCSWSENGTENTFSDEVIATGEFSVAIRTVGGGRSCGTHQLPARLFTVGEFPSCMLSTNMLIGQAGCDLVVRVPVAGHRSNCVAATHTVSDSLCAPQPNEGYVGLNIAVRYDPVEERLTAEWILSPQSDTTPRAVSWPASAASLRSWRSYPIAVCNERAMNCPWCGQISQLCIAAGRGTQHSCGLGDVTRRGDRADQVDINEPRNNPLDEPMSVLFPMAVAPNLLAPPAILLTENTDTVPIESVILIIVFSCMFTATVLICVVFCRR